VAQSRENFLLVSSRYNCRIEHELPFGAGWATALRSRVRGDGRMYPAGGSDLFVYPRGLFGSVPNFAMGRGYWDTWLMREVRRKNVSLVDATALLTAVHQEHAYEHVPGVGPDAHDKMVYETPEGRRNLALMGGHRYLYTVFDATEVLTSDGKLLSTWRVPLVQRRIKAAVRRLLWRMTFAAC
jgi:hypothetical protein